MNTLLEDVVDLLVWAFVVATATLWFTTVFGLVNLLVRADTLVPVLLVALVVGRDRESRSPDDAIV